MKLDTVVKNGTIVSELGLRIADIGISNGIIVEVGLGLEAPKIIDAYGLLVLPGGIDSHCHIDQVEPNNGFRAENFATGTKSALIGGTTTVISFSPQYQGERLRDTLAETHRRASMSHTDYSFHQIITDPSDDVILHDIPEIIASGIRSLKVFLTYEDARLNDRAFLNVLATARQHGALVTVHCENHDAINWLTEQLIAQGLTTPKYHAWSRPKIVEREATYRAIALAELVDQPIQIFHVSCSEVAEEIRRAQKRGVKVWGETCPQYLVLSKHDLDRPDFDGAKFIFSPAARDKEDQEALWNDIHDGTLNIISSDHSAYNFHSKSNSKSMYGTNVSFDRVPSGIPGIGARLPIIFSEGVSKGRIDLDSFAKLTATNAAKLFGLYPRKGVIAVGSDADLVLWDDTRRITITNELLKQGVDYTPYEGMEVTGWPVTTLLRGEVAMKDGEIVSDPGSGLYLARNAYAAITPARVSSNDFELFPIVGK